MTTGKPLKACNFPKCPLFNIYKTLLGHVTRLLKAYICPQTVFSKDKLAVTSWHAGPASETWWLCESRPSRFRPLEIYKINTNALKHRRKSQDRILNIAFLNIQTRLGLKMENAVQRNCSRKLFLHHCTLHQFTLFPCTPCMDMHGFTIAYIYIRIYIYIYLYIYIYIYV